MAQLDTDLLIQLPQELFQPAACAHYEGSYTRDALKAGADEFTFAAPLSWAVDITNTGDAFLVTGTVEGSATVACARCLEPAEYDLAGEVEGYFLIPGVSGDTQDELECDEFDILPENNTIDIRPLLDAALLMDVPTLPLCDDECKGLCSDCGANLNTNKCSCAETRAEVDAAFQQAKNPFAVLADFPFDKDEN